MPRSIETLHARRAAQLKALAQVRNTLPRGDCAMVIDLFDTFRGANGLDTHLMADWQLELVGTLAGRHLCEVA